jgi:hypothetical protein
MDAISKPLISELLQRKKSTPHLAQMGFETEMRGIPEKYKKEVNDLIWKFLWENKPNQIERNVCLLNINEGGDGND